MAKYWLLFLVTLTFAFVCGAAVRSSSPTAAVAAVVSDAQLDPLDKLRREIARRREVSSLQRDSMGTATPKLDANDRPLPNSISKSAFERSADCGRHRSWRERRAGIARRPYEAIEQDEDSVSFAWPRTDEEERLTMAPFRPLVIMRRATA